MKLIHPAVLAAIFSLSTPLSSAADTAQLERGAYLSVIMDCAGCHMPRDRDGAPDFEAGLSGGTIGFELPGLGVFWAPNLTPDATGLGGWSKDDIVQAIRYGERPDGRILAPVMPWPAYSQLTDADVDALVAFLMSMEPVEAPRFGPEHSAEAVSAPFYRVVLPAD